MSTILLATWNAGGIVRSLALLGSRLVARGHKVHVLSANPARSRFEAAGCTMHVFSEYAEFDPTTPDGDLVGSAAGLDIGEAFGHHRQRLFVGPARSVAADAAGLIRELRPQVAVVDYVLTGGLIACEAAGIPYAAACESIFPIKTDPPTPGVLFPALFERNLHGATGPINDVRRELGLEPVDRHRELMLRASARMSFTFPSFDRAAAGHAPGTVTYVGPQWPRFPARADPASRRLLVHMGTTHQGQDELLGGVIAAIAASPLRAAFTGQLDGVSLPPNAEHADGSSHEDLMPTCSGAIVHGGSGTTIKALAHGLPCLVYPLEQDQFDSARQVEHLGAGIAGAKQATRADIASHVRQLDARGDLRAGAARVRAAFREEFRPDAASQLVEDLAGGPAPG